VPDNIGVGMVLIREGTALPEALPFESEPYASGWRCVKDLDGNGLRRQIQGAGWTFFFQAGEIKVTAFGLDEQKMVHRAVARILANLKLDKFNSLEITRVASRASKHFLGVTYVTVSARSRHIQEGAFLFRTKGIQVSGTGKIADRLRPVAQARSSQASRWGKAVTTIDVTTILRL
jgi:hypothetical protein